MNGLTTEHLNLKLQLLNSVIFTGLMFSYYSLFFLNFFILLLSHLFFVCLPIFIFMDLSISRICLFFRILLGITIIHGVFFLKSDHFSPYQNLFILLLLLLLFLAFFHRIVVLVYLFKILLLLSHLLQFLQILGLKFCVGRYRLLDLNFVLPDFLLFFVFISQIAEKFTTLTLRVF